MKITNEIIETLRMTQKDYRGSIISIEIDGEKLITRTNNTKATDAAFDDNYEGEGRLYPTQQAAKTVLINEILKAN